LDLDLPFKSFHPGKTQRGKSKTRSGKDSESDVSKIALVARCTQVGDVEFFTRVGQCFWCRIAPANRRPVNKSQQPALTLFVAGLFGLGVLALVFGDFAMVWQPVPAWLPARSAVAYGSGVLMLLLGAGLLFRPTRVWSVRVLFPYLVLWALLKVPDVVRAPGIEGSWLGLGELTLLLSGGWTLFARLADLPQTSPLAFVAGERGVRMARILFALSIVPIGLSHLVYTQATAGYVPHWLPFRKGWAVLTGSGQIASGLGVLFGVLPRIAAWAEAGQITCYTLLVWLPAAIATPTRLNWTALFISWIFGAAAYAVAQNVKKKT
jgi:uncharacterized membrane protein